MDEISPLFAIQAEKALKSNNPLVALEICKRGIQYFPEYQIGYILMAEAYEMLGDYDERDKLLKQIHQQFPNAITTKAIEEKIKTEGSLLPNTDDAEEINLIEQENSEFESREEVSEAPPEEIDAMEADFEEDSLADNLNNYEVFSTRQTIAEQENEALDDLIDEAQSLIENIEETIEELEDEIENEGNEFIEETIENEVLTETEEEIIQEYAELEGEVADFQDFAIKNENPELIVEFSEELLEMEKDKEPFGIEASNQALDEVSSLSLYDINLIPGINFLPFQFDYSDVHTISKNISVEDFFNSNHPSFDNLSEGGINKDIVGKNIENVAVESSQFAPKKFAEETLMDKTLQQESNKFDDADLIEDDSFTDDFIPTETLALIYEKQGKYLNAIEIYEKLMIIHPEKMEHYLNKIMLLETDDTQL